MPTCSVVWIISYWTLFCTKSGYAQLRFVGLKDLYEVPNRQSPDTAVAVFKAEDASEPFSPLIGYELDGPRNVPFRIDGTTGELFPTTTLQLPLDTIIRLTVKVINQANGQDISESTNLKIIGAANKFSPVFPTNGSTIFLQRNASSSETVWIADTTDEDADEVNGDIVYHVESIKPEGFLEFITDTGELKLLKPAKDLPDVPIKVVLTACNGPEAKPPRCSIGVVYVETIIPQAGALIDMLDDISAEKMSALANAVEIMSEYAKKDVKVAQSMVSVVSAVLGVEPVKLSSVLSTDSSKKLTNSVGSYADDAIIPTDQGANLRMQTNNVDISLLDVKNDFAEPLLELYPAECGENATQLASNLSFTIPGTVVRRGSTGSDGAVRVSLVRYENTKLFQQAATEPQLLRKTVINCTSYSIQDSPVVVAVVKGANTDSLSAPVTFKMPKPTQNLKYKCVYWDEAASRWASEGVSVSRQSGDTIECEAHHMTAFSVLFDPTPDAGITESHKFALSLISYIGCGLSIFGCFATVLTYCFFRHLHADHAGKILINLCVAIGFLNVAFVTGSVLATYTTVLPFKLPCAVMSSIIHFFSLASFMWMGIEAFNMYQLLIRVFFTIEQKHFVLKRAVLGWGVPALVAVSTTLLELFNGEETPYGDECRLTPRNPFVYYAAFLGPFAVIIFSNTIVFIMVIFVLCKPRPDFVNVAGKKTDKQKSIRGAQVHGSLAVMFLLGVTWIFGAMAISHARLLFQYVFCLTNSLQGFLIFIFRCLERQEARSSWVRFVTTGERRPVPASSSSRRATTRSAGFSSSTGSDTRQRNVAFDVSCEDLTRKPLLKPAVKHVGNGKTNGDAQSAFMVDDYTFVPIDEQQE